MKSLVIIPYGARENIDFLVDTVDSVNFHLESEKKDIVVIDDSEGGVKKIETLYENVKVVKNKTRTTDVYGKHRNGSLLVEIIRVIKERYKNDYELAIKIDDDTVVCGDGVDTSAKKYLDKNKKVGMLGALEKRGDGTDKKEDMKRKGESLERITNMKKVIEKTRFTKSVSTLVKEVTLAAALIYMDFEARKNKKYVRGNTCTGGCYFLSEDLLGKISRMKLPVWPLAYSSNPGEDTLMTLLCYYLGLDVREFPNEKNRLAINWRGLPASLDEIVKSDISVVHPVKGIDGLEEEDIRNKIKKEMRVKA